MKRLVIVLLIFMVLVAGGLYAYMTFVKAKVPTVILTFEDCLNAGQLVVNTIPRECHTKKGEIYIEEDNHVALLDTIEVTEPKPYALVSSPFKVEGKAKGVWYGNNRLTVKLVDENNNPIVEKSMFALGNVTRDAMIAFTGAINFQVPATVVRGKLLIQKVNIEDLGVKNGPLVIPVKFK